MNVAFALLGNAPAAHACASLMVASVRRWMPGVSIVQLSDRDASEVPGVTALVRADAGPVARRVLEFYASCGQGDWLFLDTDVLVRADVRSVFDQPFDIAVADRAGTLTSKEVGTKFMARMPFNKGVMFSRSSQFWRDCVDVLSLYPDKRQAWMGDQQAVNDVISAGQYAVAVLPNHYNYPPKARHDDVKNKAVLHLKGKRKAWMADYAEVAA